MTGIDRVQLRLFDYILSLDSAWERENFTLVFRGERGELFEIDDIQARAFVALAMKPKLDKDTMATAAGDCLRCARRSTAASGDLYFIPGPFWTISSHEGLIPRLKEKGVVVGAYIYDLIPITHPQFCMAAHCNAFATAFAEIAPQLDFALTISDFVAKELRDMMATHGIAIPPIIAAPLAHELDAPADVAVMDPTALNRLGGRPFVLCVGTIEARKNHIYLLNLWTMLARENLKPPLLVFVGRLGWRVADLTDQLQSLRFVNDTIRIVNDVSDAELACLYDQCLFTIFPSFVEGWGLPVGESLARGKIVVASSAASIPEVGGSHALYIDPYNLHSGLETVRKLLTDVPYRQATEASIRKTFRPRTWAAAGEHFFGALVEGIEARAPSKPYAPALPSGRFLLLSDLVEPTHDINAYFAQPLRLILVSGWRRIDHGGSWIEDKLATVRFATNLPAGTTITVVMTFITVPWLRDSALQIRGDSGDPERDARFATRRVLQPSVMLRHTVPIAVGAGGIATMQLEIEGNPCSNPPDELAVLWIRMLTIGWCASDDMMGRLSLLEQALWT